MQNRKDNLKEFTLKEHKEAENTKFVRRILKGTITPFQYATFLFNQYYCYQILEANVFSENLFENFHEIARSKYILQDLMELWNLDETIPYFSPVTKEYIKHILSIRTDKRKLCAHVYVRHMGDLSGGQYISRKVPGSGSMYMFENVAKLKKSIIKTLDDDLTDEAKLCFRYAIRLFHDLEVNLNDMDRTCSIL